MTCFEVMDKQGKCDRQTDRQIDRQTDDGKGIPMWHTASRQVIQ